MKGIQGLVACSDLAGYAKFASGKPTAEVFGLLADYYEWIGECIADAEGKAIKFMGDAALLFFREEHADGGIRALLRLREEGDRFLAERGVSCRHHVRAHFGPVYWGLLGTREDKRPDILGETVNTMFLMKAAGFAITPEAFRKLSPETRRLFKKHTPPVSYIPMGQPHRD